MLKRQWLIVIVAVMMVCAFIPIVSFADGDKAGAENTIASTDVTKTALQEDAGDAGKLADSTESAADNESADSNEPDAHTEPSDVAEPEAHTEPADVTEPEAVTEPTKATDSTSHADPMDADKAGGAGNVTGPAPKKSSGKDNISKAAASAVLVAVNETASLPGYELTTVGVQQVPLSGDPIISYCCILHLILLLAAVILLVLYILNMKKHQARIFELEKELEGYFDE